MKTEQTPLADFQQYIRRPYYVQPLAEAPGQHSFATTLRLFTAEYPLFLGLTILSVGIMLLTERVTGQVSYATLLQRVNQSLSVLIVALVVAVMLIETAFRSILRLTPNRLSNLVSLLLLVLLSMFYRDIKAVTHPYAGLWLLAIWAVLTYGVRQLVKQQVLYCRIESFWISSFRCIFYGIAILYALLRVSNATVLSHWQILLPALLLLRLLTGFYLGYVRMKYGFWFAVAVHTLTMATPVLLALTRFV